MLKGRTVVNMVFRQILKCIFCVALMGFQLSIQAATAPNLYQASIIVASQTESERQKVLPEAMQQVLIKQTGNPRVADNPKVRSYLYQAANYIQQYHYNNSSDGNKLTLIITFNAYAIDNLLQTIGQQKWLTERPLILVWLAKEADGQRNVVDENDALGRELRFVAEQYGIPVIFPAYDLEDLQQVSIDDLWVPNLNPIQNAAQRYQADEMLIGRVIRNGSQNWAAQWQLGRGAQWQTIIATGASSDAVMHQSLAQVVAQLAAASLTSVSTVNSGKKVEIVVNGITGLADYQRVLEHLQKLAPSQSVQVLNVGADQVTFNITTQGSEENIIAAIQQGGLLVALPRSDQHVLEYQLSS